MDATTSPIGNKFGNSMSKNPSVLHSLIGNVPILGQYSSLTDVQSVLSINLCIQSTSLDSLRKREIKDDE